MTATNKGVALYLHIPFCLRKCRYCDFCSFDSLKDEQKNAYLAALLQEIQAFPRAEDVSSIFFGGGTPSLLSEESLERILSLIRQKFRVLPDCEITLEANPASVDAEGLAAFRRLGVNRLSIGVQSFSDSVLRTLGRLHTASDAEAFFKMARQAGFDNINLDLMYATPGESEDALSASLRKAISLAPEHISAYGLILEEGTDFDRCRESLCFLSPDREADYYEIVSKTLSSAGYYHYEISNYAKSGKECCHNLTYWQSRPYIGFGVSAYSLYGGYRYGNTRDLALYLSDPCHAVSEREEMTPENRAYDYVMLALRTACGVCEEEYRLLFGKSFYDEKRAEIDRYIRQGYMEYDGKRTRLTERGFYVSDAILITLL